MEDQVDNMIKLVAKETEEVGSAVTSDLNRQERKMAKMVQATDDIHNRVRSAKKDIRTVETCCCWAYTKFLFSKICGCCPCSYPDEEDNLAGNIEKYFYL